MNLSELDGRLITGEGVLHICPEIILTELHIRLVCWIDCQFLYKCNEKGDHTLNARLKPQESLLKQCFVSVETRLHIQLKA